MLKKITAMLAAAVLLVAALLTQTGCRSRAQTLDYEGFLFDTYVSIRIYDGSEEILGEAVALCREYDRLFDRTDEKSDIWAINHSDGQPVMVGVQTAALLLEAQEYSRLSGGSFDVTCGAVTALWDFAAQPPTLPAADALAGAVQTVGADRLTVDGRTVTVQPGTQIDLGGIAKGFIADRVAEYLASAGIENAVINLGGNVLVMGDKFGSGYRIGIASPFGAGNIAELTLSDCSAVTAGSYQRGFTLEGQYYHHILDLADGYPADTGLASVTVVSRTSVQGDAMATILFLRGLEAGLELAEQTPGIEALFVTGDGQIIKTTGLN